MTSRIISPFGVGPWSSGGAAAVGFTQSLAHFNGADGATTTTDEIGGRAWTLGTLVELDTSTQQFGTACVQCINNNQRSIVTGLTIPVGSSFTVESFVRTNLNADFAYLDSNGDLSSMYFAAGNGSVEMFVDTTGADVLLSPVVTFTAATWYHIAIVRDVAGGVYSMYFDGNRIATVANASNLQNAITVFHLYDSGGTGVRHDEFRVSTVARYTGATYTIPAAEFVVD